MTTMPRWRRGVALGAGAALVAGGALAVDAGSAPTAQAATDGVTVTPNPWYAGAPFEGWGTSLVWMANATGGYPDELREELYQAVFGDDGMNLNIARYNVGGGHASDVTDYLRPGGAVEGYWAEDTTGDLYGAPTTVENRAAVLDAWDPDNPEHYDLMADPTQRWWVERLVEDERISHWEVFANSAPYFMTQNGYVSGGFNGNDENLNPAAMDKFAGYLVTVAEFLEDEYGLDVATIDPFNEPNTNYWSTQLGPDGNPTGGRQEGMHVGPERQVDMIAALDERLETAETDAVISAMDETNPSTFARNWNAYTPEARAAVEQMNVHTYGTGDRRVVRDLAKSADTRLWQSEIEGNWYNNGFNPAAIENGLGIAERIQSDLRELEPGAWVLWQPVEDLYNMESTGENLNWGSVFIDFDCAPGEDGVWRSARRVADADGDLSQVPECEIIVGSKFAAVQHFTHYIEPGDRIIATDSTAATAAVSEDDESVTLVYRNTAAEARDLTVDLTRFAEVAPDATVRTVTTTQGTEAAPLANALVEGAPQAVSGDAVTVEVPAESLTTVVIDGVSGVADDAAPVTDGGTYQLVGVQSGKPLSVGETHATVIRSSATTPEKVADQLWTVHEAPSDVRSDVRPYVLTTADGRVLGATAAGTDLRDISVEEAQTTSQARWMLTTEDGRTWSLVNEALSQAMEVNGQSTADDAQVGTWSSGGGAHQRWTVRDTAATGSQQVEARTLAGIAPTLPQTVVPTYAWGTGQPAPVVWDLPGADVWETTGEVVVTGTATDVYGNEVAAQAVVVVGGHTITDPVSVTVRTGVSVEAVAGAAPQTVPARTGASLITFPADVVWDFTDVTAEDLAEVGVVTVPGSAQSNDPDVELDATLSVIVTEPAPFNIAPLDSTSVSATFTEPGYDVNKTRDEVLGDKAWSNWRSGTKNASDTFTYEFDEVEDLHAATIHFYRDGSHLSWAQSVSAEYLDADGTWQAVPGYETPQPVVAPEDGTAPVVTLDLSDTAGTTGLRVVMNAPENTHMIVSEVEVMAMGPGVASVADLAALRVDGTSVPGFAPDVTEYSVTVEGERLPVVTAFAVDEAATVEVVQPTAESPRAVVSVVSADGEVSREYTVDVERQLVLTQPQLVGEVVEGRVVTAHVESNPADAELTYRWLLDGTVLEGASNPWLLLPDGTAGSSVQVIVRAAADGFLRAEAASQEYVVAAASAGTPGEDDGGSTPPPGDGGTGEDPTPGTPADGEDGAADEDEKQGGALPSTGAGDIAALLLVTLFLLGGGTALALRRRSTS
ncbi:RICIN domain-containing protein [Georgenia satyanarayanai]|uniref:RICIN domain-containing protein n=1 Tax=Georgenia satyanarayanai TaxID=860221 RepID=UPI002041060C|nr:glycoside hydrolase [Georgenia satyanarayanai]MCM3659509.1 RICIN domain-containing protein [Georgenia satyanarayanai]